ncbi:polyprenol reductase-like [Oppia nitens]|uniref:polyprenol reductase-like n=1 Tax=Oppia nitens TaxID=1686743 RepID=UPI0023DC4F03|nr:polyprenol reductase-like [Oppia nitens]
MICLLTLFWLLVTIGVLVTTLATIYLDRLLPKSMSNLVTYGKLIDRFADNTDVTYDKIFDSFVAKYLSLPKKYFTHFYIFSLIYHLIIITLLLTTNCFTNTNHFSSDANNWCHHYVDQVLLPLIGTTIDISFKQILNVNSLLLITSIIVQMSRRLYENMNICVFSNTKINIIQYTIGFAFYLSCGLALIHAINDNNTTENNYRIIFSCLSFVAFLVASYLQFKSYQILANLRIKKIKDDNKVVTYDHFIPMGGLFDLISCPHYFAEIIIYFCICLITGFNILWSYLLVWVIVNQTLAALLSHKWYLKTFQHKYPKHRKTIFPYIL